MINHLVGDNIIWSSHTGTRMKSGKYAIFDHNIRKHIAHGASVPTICC